MVKLIYLHFNKQLQKLVKPKKPLHFSGFFMHQHKEKQRLIYLFIYIQPYTFGPKPPPKKQTFDKI